MNIIIRIAIISVLFCIGISVGIASFLYARIDVPNYDTLKNYSPDLGSKIFSADGYLIDNLAIKNRTIIDISEIPDTLKNAFISAEDKTFYENSGVDFTMIFTAAIRNIYYKLNHSSKRYGASTITQQVVKNLIVGNDKTYTRKLKEAVISLKIGKKIPKDNILEIYLNHIYLGHGAYGIYAASNTYFDKKVEELSIAEMALLAALPKAPSRFDPFTKSERVLMRRNWVLTQMYENGYITEEEMADGIATEISLSKPKSLYELPQMGGYLTEVKSRLIDDYGYDNVFKNGMLVHTTINAEYQKYLKNSFDRYIYAYDKRHDYRGVIGNISISNNWCNNLQNYLSNNIVDNHFEVGIVIDKDDKSLMIGLQDCKMGEVKMETIKWIEEYNFKIGDIIFARQLTTPNTSQVEDDEMKAFEYTVEQIPEVNGAAIVMKIDTGEIVAMVGGYDDSPNQFNRATQAMRQPGSLMKPFTYLAALQKGYSPSFNIADAEINLSKGSGNGVWSPQNHDSRSHGSVSMRYALERSLNIPTVRMGELVGASNIARIVDLLDITKDPPRDLSLVLGSNETHLINIARAYAVIANGGYDITPYYIKSVHNRDMEEVYHAPDQIECDDVAVQDKYDATEEGTGFVCKSLLLKDRKSTYQLLNLLQGVVERGTGRGLKWVNKYHDIELAGKTGTTNDSKDSWFIGLSPEYVVAAYAGFDVPRTLGDHEYGATIGLPIVARMMYKLDHHKTKFSTPEGLYTMKVDWKTGLLPNPNTKYIINEVYQEGNEIPQNKYTESELYSVGGY